MSGALAVPTVNLNGTSKAALLAELIEAMQAVSAAIDVVQKITVNGRDFHFQPDVNGKTALFNAVDQHRARVNALMGVHDELEAIAIGVNEQGG